MCQIQFIKRLSGTLAQRDIKEFFKLMEIGSIDNNCAFGFFNDKVFHKSKGRFNLGQFGKNSTLLKSSFIVGHNRLATTGKNTKPFNNHPFRLNDFILVHNGIIDNHEELRLEYKINPQPETDSYVILWLINYFYTNSKIRKRNERICEAINKTTNLLSGYYSVFLYNKNTNDLYYFKNSRASFAFCLFDSQVLIGSTDPANLEHVYLDENFLFDKTLFKERTLKKVEDNKIYLINNKAILKEIGRFESGGFFNSYRHSSWDSGEDDYPDTQMFVKEDIDLAFRSCIGYIPDYKYIDNTGQIIIKVDERVYKDLSYFVNSISSKDGWIIFDAYELLLNLDAFY